MARRYHTEPTLKIALSPTATALALGLNFENKVKPAIARGELGPLYDVLGRKRLLCADIERWIKTFPVTSLARKARPHA